MNSPWPLGGNRRPFELLRAHAVEMTVAAGPMPPTSLGQVVVYETATGRRLGTATSPALSIYGETLVTLAFSPDGRRLAAQGWGGPGALSLFCARP